jgi:asparagine synthase (glutamine-hydrolysing)
VGQEVHHGNLWRTCDGPFPQSPSTTSRGGRGLASAGGMCGFVGGILHRPVTDDDLRIFRRGAATLAHRGPDDDTVAAVAEAHAVLAFRRLSIIDLATGRQPMATGDGRHLLFNGEIYEHLDRRRELEQEGVTFRTTSDTEVLLWTLAREGVAGLAKLRGMFGLAFLDIPRRSLLLARDRLGIKQVYYVDRPEGFFFASEPKALLALPWVQPSLDTDQLASYFDLRCVPSPGTLFRGIERLAPGTTLTRPLAGGPLRIERYWALPTAPDPGASRGTIGDAVDRVEEALLRSVRRRLVADVPVGAFLSGGLDSALVVTAMRKLGHPDLQTFTATFPGSPDDEAALAARVSAVNRTRHHPVPLHADDFLSFLPRWVELNDDLVADASALPLHAVSARAREAGCIVLLSGEGADELFAGYGASHKYLLLRRLRGLIPSAAARTRLLRAAVAAGWVARQDVPRLDAYFVRDGGYLGAAALGDETELRRLLVPDLVAPNILPRAAEDDLVGLCRFDLGPRISDDLLVRTDRATMGASIEARVPFLDHDLVETVIGLPDRARALPGVSKVALRLLARRWGVPRQTLWHRKIGFQLPLASWFRGTLRPVWCEFLAERAIPGLRYERVTALLDLHDRGIGSHEEMLWRIFALECWHRRWVRSEALPEATRGSRRRTPVGAAA